MTRQINAKPHVVIVGGGLSGLTTAFYLQRAIADIQLSILESAPQIGGVIQTEPMDGYLVEHGADMFATQPGDAFQLCQDLGIEEELLVPNVEGRGAMIVRGDQLHPVPEGFVLMRPTRTTSILKTPLLSLSGKMRLLGERWIATRKETTDESVADFTRRRLGQETLDRIVQPLVGGIYTADHEQLSMAATMRTFVNMERQHSSLAAATAARQRRGEDSPERNSSGARYSQFRGFPKGMSSWLQTIADRLPKDSLRLQTSVRSVIPVETEGHDQRWDVETTAGKLPQADAIVLATPAAAAAKLCAPFASSIAEPLGTLKTASSVITIIAAANKDIARLPKTFGFVVPAAEKKSILACSFANHKFAGRCPEDTTLMRIFMGGALRTDLLERTDAELLALIREELGTWIGWNGKAIWTKAVRWNNAMPQYHVGHLDRVDKIESSLAAYPTMALAGNSLHGVGIAPVIRTAKQAAARIAASLAVDSESGVPKP